MKFILSPIASNRTTEVSVNGLVITVDGTDYDLSVIPEGGQAEAEAPFHGVVTRDEVTIEYHYDMMLAKPDQSTDWDDYTFIDPNGVVPSPIKWKPVQVEVTENV